MNVVVIIPAAGSGERFAKDLAAQGMGDGGLGGRTKLDEDLGGRPVLQRTVELFTKRADVGGIIVAGPHDPAAFDAFKERNGDKLGLLGVKLVRGGKTHRYETVQAALAAVPESATHVAVHDAARPCASEALIERVFGAAELGNNAVVPAVDVADTLKRVGEKTVSTGKPDPLAAILGAAAESTRAGGGGQVRLVEQTIDRARLVAVQTPQIFEVSLLKRAYQQKDLSSTDDSQLIERLGEPVAVVAGEAGNIKITRGADIALARAILGVRPPAQRDTHKRF